MASNITAKLSLARRHPGWSILAALLFVAVLAASFIPLRTVGCVGDTSCAIPPTTVNGETKTSTPYYYQPLLFQAIGTDWLASAQNYEGR